MKFWDTSAVLPLLVEEVSSSAHRAIYSEDPVVAVWALTRTEATSALQRRVRSGDLERHDLPKAMVRLRDLEEQWIEVDALDVVRHRADRLLAVHPLSVADALQLAAALVLAGERPQGWTLLTCDARLSAAAVAEGFDVPAAA